MNDQQQQRDRVPKMEIHVDQSSLEDVTTDVVFRALLALDITEACAVIGKTAKNRDTFDEEPNIHVTISGSGLLQMTVRTDVGVWLNMVLDPAKFDRTKPKHENLLQRCATLVKAIHEAPIPAEDDDDVAHPSLNPFEFWQWTDMESADEMAPKWTHLAEVWAAAAK